jgi:hypothetical protein
MKRKVEMIVCPARVVTKTFASFFFPSLLANAMGRIGGITSPFIISESTSLRTIGVIMFLVSGATAIFTRCLPETVGRPLGDFDDKNDVVVVVELPSKSKLEKVVHYPSAVSLGREGTVELPIGDGQTEMDNRKTPDLL